MNTQTNTTGRAVHDTTRTAGSLRAGEIVNDDQAYGRIYLEHVALDGEAVHLVGRVVVVGQPVGTGKLATRTWRTTDRVTVTWEVTDAEPNCRGCGYPASQNHGREGCPGLG